jgi:DNA primase large subunit
LIQTESGIECEVNPKQKSLNKDSKFGNLVKVPVCVNWKSRARSQFLDPATFEPYKGMVPIPDIVSLNDMGEPQKEAQKKRKTVRRRGEHEESTRVPVLVGHSLRLCMRSVLDANVALESAEGHEMRVAIAVEAWNNGLSVEDCIELFCDQPDFNSELTRRKVEEIYAHCYRPYSCDTLRDKCGSFVASYCSNCSLS